MHGIYISLVNLSYCLSDCPQGSLLINATVADSRCRFCDPGTYSFSPFDGCDRLKQKCYERDCIQCPGLNYQAAFLGYIRHLPAHVPFSVSYEFFILLKNNKTKSTFLFHT